MEDFICPRCKTSKFQNPSLKMMVNICGHGLCESCVDLLFLKGSGACPECKIPLRRINFRVQLFEDATVEKEVDIRRRVLKDFNKKEEDFGTLREYNDYLEDVETIIYNLAHDIDVINTNKKIEHYKRENREQILKNKSRLGRDEYELEEQIELEKHQELYRIQEIAAEEVAQKKRKIREKEALIDELMFSNSNARNIVDTFAKQAQENQSKDAIQSAAGALKDAKKQQPTQFSSGIQFGTQSGSQFLPVPLYEDGPLYHYSGIVLSTNGPRAPSMDEIAQRGYKSHIRGDTEQERAGGYKCDIACSRALQDAFSGLFYVHKKEKVIV